MGRHRFWIIASALLVICAAPASLSAGNAKPGKTNQGHNKSLPKAEQSGIQHIVVVMMENRSFDHFLGWLPNADGMQAGLSYADETGAVFQTAPLAPDYMGCEHPDPDHSWEGGRAVSYTHLTLPTNSRV